MKKKVWDSKWFSRLLQIYGFITICTIAVPTIWEVAVFIDVFEYGADTPSPPNIIYILLIIGLFLCVILSWMYRKTEEK